MTEAKYTLQKTGLRAIGSRRIVTFRVGESSKAAREAVAGDEISDELFKNLTCVGLDRLSGALALRGLECGEISTEGARVNAGRSWLIYPLGKVDETWAEICEPPCDCNRSGICGTHEDHCAVVVAELHALRTRPAVL